MASGGGNIFAALAKSKSKKKSSEPKEPRESQEEKHAALEAAIFSAPSGTGLSNWADDSEEEDGWGAEPQAAHDLGGGWEEVRCCELGSGDPALSDHIARPRRGALPGLSPSHPTLACCPTPLAGQGRLQRGQLRLRRSAGGRAGERERGGGARRRRRRLPPLAAPVPASLLACGACVLLQTCI